MDFFLVDLLNSNNVLFHLNKTIFNFKFENMPTCTCSCRTKKFHRRRAGAVLYNAELKGVLCFSKRHLQIC